MKPRYNLSKIMKEANRLMKYEGYNRSQALTLAWSKARRSEFYLIIEIAKPSPSFEFNINDCAKSLTSYYANNMYNGD